MRPFYLIIFCFCSLAQASTWNSYLLNEKAVESLKAEENGEGLQSLVQALSEDPLNSKLHMNLGLVLMALDEPEQAAKSFSVAGKIEKNKEMLFVAHFNAGVAFAAAKQVEKALQSYQKALEINPTSVEVKTNIELLLQSQQNQDQSGGGEGEPKKDQDQKDKGEGQGDQDQPPPQEQPQKQKKPKEFKSEELTASDVKKILEELKSQEQGIRAKEYEKGPKERPSGKDW